MKFIADLQIHSRYAMACSRQITLKNLEKFARIKGINVMGTGDFIHPKWLQELKQELRDRGDGVLETETRYPFILQGEVSNIFHQDGKLRKIHNIILARSFDVVDQIAETLGKRGNLSSDGRPIFGKYSCIELVEDMMSIDRDIEIIPAHVMTPWFGLFGSKSGFDSVEDCFREKSKHIHAIETGMSADPRMLWRVSGLDKYALVSNSDSHSFWPWRVGREATVFELGSLSYDGIISAIRTGKGLHSTIEVYPAYGKYHWDGHRACGISMGSKDSMKCRGICPKCGRGMTIGVEYRVEEIADRAEGFFPKGSVPFISIIPLSEIICSVTGAGQPYSKSVWVVYDKLVKEFGSEFNVLLDASMDDLAKVSDEKIASAIIGIREGKVEIAPGYDGEYGRLLFDGKRTETQQPLKVKCQKSLADY